METIKSKISNELYDYLLKYKEDCLNGKYTGIVNIVSRYHKEFLEEIKNITSFLNINAKPCERLYCIYNNITAQPKCLYCDNNVLFDNVYVGYHPICKNKKCIIKKINDTYDKKYIGGRKNKEIIDKVKATKLKKYGDENYHNMLKTKETNLKKYGVEYVLKSEKIKEKVKKTKLKKYGDEFYTNREQAAKSYKNRTLEEKKSTTSKKEKTMQEKYGVNSSLQLEHVRVAASNGKVKKYIENVRQLCEKNNAEYLDYIKKENMHLCKCKKCNEIFKISKQYILYHNLDTDSFFCPNCSLSRYSNFEKEISKFLDSYNIKYINNYRFYYTKNNYHECDIFLPEYNLGIECNGVYWHSELYRDKKYHIRKKEFIENEGNNLIFIWEDDWKNSTKREIIKSRILSKIGKCEKIYARQCTLKEISYKDANDFLNNYHLYGSSISKYNFGLFFNDELISVMTFSKARKIINSNSSGYEMVRFATKNNITIVGGMSKMINHFKKQIKTEHIYSYVDLDWSKLKNNSYEKIGFNIIKQTEPDYWWCINGIRENRIKYMKHKLVEMGYDKNKTENEIMYENKHYKIYGCGNLLVKI